MLGFSLSFTAACGLSEVKGFKKGLCMQVRVGGLWTTQVGIGC